MTPIQLGIVEDETLVLENLNLFFEHQPDVDVVLTANSVEGFLEEFDNFKLDVLLLDIGLPGMSGLEAIRILKGKQADIDILMLTSFDDSDKIFKALCAGADAYLLKRTPLKSIKEAIVTVHKGGSYMSPTIARKVVDYFAPKQTNKDELLTSRQLQIVEGLVEGLSYKMIADKYLISVETVRDHIKKIYKKLHVNSKAEVIKKRLNNEI
ncbi:MAG: response regulator transcription factor [Chitinophagales bacterium]|nr:response regulator transcription factor [Chitinophagales bacterium]